MAFNIDQIAVKYDSTILPEEGPCVIAGQIRKYDEEGNQIKPGKQICIKVEDLPANEAQALETLRAYLESQINA